MEKLAESSFILGIHGVNLANGRPISHSMNNMSRALSDVILAAVATVELLQRIMGTDLPEETVDKVFCNTYREHFGTDALAPEIWARTQ